MSTTYLVAGGMSCGHCAAAVTAAIGRLTRVTGVEVGLRASRSSAVWLDSSVQLRFVSVRATVDAAGYELVGGLA